jgi:hypothetical protein
VRVTRPRLTGVRCALGLRLGGRRARRGRQGRCRSWGRGVRLRLDVEVDAGPRRRGVVVLAGATLVVVGPRRPRSGGWRRGEVLPGEAGPPRRRARGRPRASDAAETARGVAHAAEDGVELLDLGVGNLVHGRRGGDVTGGVGGGSLALALGGGRRVHGRRAHCLSGSGRMGGVWWLRSVLEEKKKGGL